MRKASRFHQLITHDRFTTAVRRDFRHYFSTLLNVKKRWRHYTRYAATTALSVTTTRRTKEDVVAYEKLPRSVRRTNRICIALLLLLLLKVSRVAIWLALIQVLRLTVHHQAREAAD